MYHGAVMYSTFSNWYNSKANHLSATQIHCFEFRPFPAGGSITQSQVIHDMTAPSALRYLSWNVLGEITVRGELELAGVPGPVIHNLNVS